MGRPHRVRGLVGRGAGRGAGLGFPTANLVEIDTLIPADGVYAALARVDGRGPSYPAACNIGPNPTFGEHGRKVEAHLVGFSGDLYGGRVEVDFIRRLRDTRRFSGRGRAARSGAGRRRGDAAGLSRWFVKVRPAVAKSSARPQRSDRCS